jgi:D-serine deaminase-like pyridoxal phosphate-dependent protein
MSSLFPSPAKSDLSNFIGQPLSVLPTPCAILHEATVRRNCERLVEITTDLGIGFRPHVKTHKVRFRPNRATLC